MYLFRHLVSRVMAPFVLSYSTHSLADNNIGDEGAIALSASIRMMTNLRYLE